MTDAWAAANQAQAGQANGTSTEERLIDPPTSEDNIESRLFGGESLPSVWNKTLDKGSEITAIIKDVPFEKQGRTYVAGGVGKLKFWKRASGQTPPWTTDAADAEGPLRPVMDLVLPLQTEYRFTPAQLEDKNMEEDTGARGWYFSGGEGEQEFKRAIKAAKLRSMRELVGMRITGKRTGQVKKGDFMAWTYAITLEKA